MTKPFGVGAIAGALIMVPAKSSGSANGPAPTRSSEQPPPALELELPLVQRAWSHVAPPVHVPAGVPLTSLSTTVTELAEVRSTSEQPVATTLQSAARAATPIEYLARGMSGMPGC